MSGSVYLMLSKTVLPIKTGTARFLQTAIFPSGRKILFSVVASPADAGEYLKQAGWECVGLADLKTVKILQTDRPFPLKDPSVMTLLYGNAVPDAQKAAIAEVLEAWKKGTLFRPSQTAGRAVVSGPDIHY